MKKFLIKLVCYALSLLLIPLAVFVYAQSSPRVYGGLIGSIRQKNIILKQTSSPRIIIVGGSSAPYSVITQEVEAAFGMPCINMGATAYFGLEFYLSVVQPELKSGDIVILAPEFNIYNGDFAGSIVWGGIENDIDLLFKLPITYIPKMVKSYYEYFKTKLELKATPIVSDEQAYTSFGFGEHGDILTLRENILDSKYNTQDTHEVTADILNKRFARAVKRFTEKAEKKGARVFWTAAPLNRLSLNSDISEIYELEQAVSEKCGVKIIGRLRDGVMDEELFYDSNFHLNTEGAELFTKRLIDNLKSVI